MIISKLDTIMNVDVEMTTEYYSKVSLCDCPWCRNYYFQIGHALPQLKKLLSQLGVDISRPDELGFSTENGEIYYHFAAYTVCGSIEKHSGGEADLKENGLHLSVVIDDHYVPSEQKNDYFTIWVYGIVLPWALDEPNPDYQITEKNSKDKLLSRCSEHRCILVKKYRTLLHHVFLLDDHGKRFKVNVGKGLYDTASIGERLTVGRIGRRLINIRPGHIESNDTK